VASPHPVPAPVRLALLALPPLIAAGLYWQAQHFDHGLVDLRPERAASGTSALGTHLPGSLGGRQRAGAPRAFSRDTLYEYVDGHAEYYVTAGFEGLAVGEYGADAQGQPALVVNLWDMGRPLHAFGVLMDEAGADAVPLEGDVLGFRTSNGLSLAHGRYYLQVNSYLPGYDPAPDLAELLGALGPADRGGAAALHFPALGRVLGTRFVKENYRGLDMLANALVRRFERDGVEMEAFVIQGSDEQIADIARRLQDFLAAEGMPREEVALGRYRVHQVSDRYEGDWFYFVAGGRLVGVYARLDPALTEAVRAYLAEGGSS
jgi:Family of unknown function (DUF6599)